MNRLWLGVLLAIGAAARRLSTPALTAGKRSPQSESEYGGGRPGRCTGLWCRALASGVPEPTSVAANPMTRWLTPVPSCHAPAGSGVAVVLLRAST